MESDVCVTYKYSNKNFYYRSDYISDIDKRVVLWFNFTFHDSKRYMYDPSFVLASSIIEDYHKTVVFVWKPIVV